MNNPIGYGQKFKLTHRQTKEIIIVRVEGTQYNFQGYAFHYCVLENDIQLLRDYIRLACRHNADPTYNTNIIIREHRETKTYKLDKFYRNHLDNYTVEVIGESK